jgi:hypothetical protein
VDHERNFFNPFKDYFWAGVAMGMNEESGRDDMEALCPGLDCAVNCHLGLVNVEKAVPRYSTANLNRNRDPGVGAFTYYHNGTTLATRDIPAGGELFKYYGDHWFTVRESVFGNIPLTDDYGYAETLLESLMVLLEVRHQTTKGLFNTKRKAIQRQPMSPEMVKDMYEMVLVPLKRSFDSRTLNALPDRWEDALTAAKAGELAAILQPQHIRSVQWLEEHGTCIDHIRPGISTLPQAGHGAFATRDLPAGTVIAISPLHHLPSYTFMNMYNFSEHPDSHGRHWYKLVDQIEHHQLFLNYCYGHSKSTVLLCPYGAGVSYVNHNQTQQNVGLEWPTSPDFVPSMHNATAVAKGLVKDLGISVRPQLAIQYVATKDIQRGDELFLDYGDEWEQMWWEHVARYRPPENPYISAHLWNEEFADTAILTEIQQHVDPYPDNLQIRCHSILMRDEANMYATYMWTDKDYGYSCRIVDRFRDDDKSFDLYTVVLEWQPGLDDDDDELAAQLEYHRITWVERTDVPRSAIRFFDMPYTTDMHLSSTFRHKIGIPDEMFPDQWKNI